MHLSSKILITGGRGLVGRALDKILEERGFENVWAPPSLCVDLRAWMRTAAFFEEKQFDYVFHCAARVGGIIGNSKAPGDFIRDNLLINTNVINAAKCYGVKKLLFLGSACAYPKFAENPIKESSLLCGELEPSNRAYAVAKIAGIEMCNAYRAQYGCNFISAMPTNLYGPHDHYDLESSHVIPGMIRRIHEAKQAGAGEVALWGTGNPTREFLFSEDLARACLLLMEQHDTAELVNIGCGEATPLFVLAEQISSVVGFTGRIVWDKTKPDGTPNRRLDSSKIFGLGWRPSVNLHDGLIQAYHDFLRQAYGN